MSWPWSELGLEGPSELPEIRRAYAQRLKTTHPEEDPAGFQRLHDAYQQACRIARQKKRGPVPSPMEEERPRPQEAGPAPAEETDQGEDWDFDRLTAGETETDSRQDESASQDEAPPQTGDEEETASRQEGPEQEAQDWDFERLFAEGEEEASAARRRKIEELREKHRARFASQEREQRRRAENEREAWEAVMAATHALELLSASGAPLPQWRAFLNSQVFWNVRGNLDFLFAMEDFVEQNPDLPKAVRKAIFAAYGFTGHVKPEQRRLYRLLDVDRRERWKLRWSASPLRRKWRVMPPRQRFATVFGLVFLALLAVIGFWDLVAVAGAAMGSLSSWQKEMCQRLEEDYGRAFVHPYKEGEYIFAPEDDQDLLFFACEEKGGYRTNYPDRMVMEQMELFAWKWGLELGFDSANGYKGQLGETPGAYQFQLPLTGAGEAISELGELLAALKTQDWYQKQPPDFEVFLCYGDLNFYNVRSTEKDFDGDYARTIYENKFGPELCRYIAEHTGLAAESMGEDAYVLMERGLLTLGTEGEQFFWVTGMSKPPEGVPLAHYFLSTDGTTLYAASDAQMNSGFDLEDLKREVVGKTHILPELGEHSYIQAWDLTEAEQTFY